jgi:hypothetical protein
MIIVKLGGGLGNQLCQYAFGRSLSLKNHDILKLDLDAYTIQNPRVYGLGNFNIIENIATKQEIQNLRLPFGFLSRCVRSFNTRILRQYNIGFNPKQLKLKGNLYLEGYWKNEKYFNSIKETIYKEITLRRPLSNASQIIKDCINEEICAVSLHVRRGDYVQDHGTSKYHGICSQEYYRDALAYLSMRVTISCLYIFSDEIDWVKNNMFFDFPVKYVSQEGIPDYEELHLMSTCKHHIIANSSFSWWGAWLNRNEDKIVIAPKKWTNIIPEDHPNIIPASWTRI